MNVFKIINKFFNSRLINKFYKNTNISNVKNDSFIILPTVNNIDSSFINISNNNSSKYFNDIKNCEIDIKHKQNDSFISISNSQDNEDGEQKTKNFTNSFNNHSMSFIEIPDDSIQKKTSNNSTNFFSNTLKNVQLEKNTTNKSEKNSSIFFSTNKSNTSIKFDKISTIDSFFINKPEQLNNNNSLTIEEFLSDKPKNDFNIMPIQKIKVNKMLTKREAATKISAHAKGLLTRIKLKTANQYGFKELKYSKKNNSDDNAQFTQEFLVSKNGYVFVKPQLNSYIHNGEQGGFKKIIAKDNHSVLFSIIHANDSQSTLSSHEIEDVLDKCNISTYKITHKIDKKIAIARNAGQKDLKSYSKNNPCFSINDFKNILIDTKKLHENGYYHLDLKSQNIQVKENNKNNSFTKTLSVIDLDSLSHFSKIPKLAGTPFNTTYSLMQSCFPKAFCDKNEQDSVPLASKESLQAFDEYAIIIAILESMGVTIDRPKEPWIKFNFLGLGNIKITKEITNFINENIKEEFKKIFTLLINDPIQYIDYLSQNKDKNIYLANMINFK